MENMLNEQFQITFGTLRKLKPKLSTGCFFLIQHSEITFLFVSDLKKYSIREIWPVYRMLLINFRRLSGTFSILIFFHGKS